MRIWRQPGGQRIATPRSIGPLSSLVSCLVLSHEATLRLPIHSIDLGSRTLKVMMIIMLLSLSIRVTVAPLCLLAKQHLYALLSYSM